MVKLAYTVFDWFTRVTDRRTDRQTELQWLRRAIAVPAVSLSRAKTRRGCPLVWHNQKNQNFLGVFQYLDLTTYSIDQVWPCRLAPLTVKKKAASVSWKPLPAGKASHTADQLIPRRGSHEQLQLFSVLAHGPEWYYRTTPLKCLPPEDLYRYRVSSRRLCHGGDSVMCHRL